MEYKGVKKIMRNKIIMSAVMFLFLLVFAGFSVTYNESGILGNYLYSMNYKALLDYDGVYYTDLIQYSDISAATGQQIYIYYKIEKTALISTFSGDYTFNSPYGANYTILDGTAYDTNNEEGNITITVNYQYANGTSLTDTKYNYFNAGIGILPYDFYTSIGRGDTALVTVGKTNEANNITRFQVVKTVGTAIVTVNKYPSLDSMSEHFADLVEAEKDTVLNVVPIVNIALQCIMIVGIPIGIILFLLWSFGKMRDGLLKLIRG